MNHSAKNAIMSAATALVLAGPAAADQYIISLSEPLDGVSTGLLDTLKIAVVDSFAYQGENFAVIEAPNDAYLEAFFSAITTTPVSLRQLPIDWTGEAMAAIDTSARLRFGDLITCGFCS
ncbi:MAG: hypothetical protein P8N72_10200 [Flavimaricola sp.]|nr:hypothetical protein [Flavimaricola sp.]